MWENCLSAIYAIIGSILLLKMKKSRYVLSSGETEISKKTCNGSPGKFSIWWTLLSLGLQRNELHQGWLVFTNQRVIFCKRHWLKADLLGIFHAFIPSKRIFGKSTQKILSPSLLEPAFWYTQCNGLGQLGKTERFTILGMETKVWKNYVSWLTLNI